MAALRRLGLIVEARPSWGGAKPVVVLMALAVAVCCGITAQADPTLPIIPATNFSIISFGAFGNGTSNDATAIQNTINAAAAAGGGTVQIPTNGTSTYLCGPIILTNSINLQIDSGATLKMLSFGTYPTNGTIPDFISGTSLHDVEISGSGTIDGSATTGTPGWWDNRATSLRPLMIKLDTCQKVLIQNLHLKNPPKMHIGFKGTGGNITIQNLTINTPVSPNTDGIDLAGTNCLVRNCTISDGDDNIAFSPTVGTFDSDILISNCTFGIGHGVSMGSNTAGGLSNLTVTGCTFTGTDYGIRMKSDNNTNTGGSVNGRGGVVQNLTYSNIQMANIVRGAIVIYSYYNEVGTPTSITPFGASTQTMASFTIPVWRNITISNVTATVASGGVPGILWGRMETVISNVTLSQVNITASKPFEVYNARAIQFIDSQFTTPGTNTLNLFNAEVTITNSTPSANVVTLGGLAKPGTNNPLAIFNAQVSVTDTNLLGTGPITLGGSTLSFSQTAVISSNTPVSIVSASTLVFTKGTNVFGGALSGAGPLTLNLTNSSIMLTLQGNCSGFTGTLAITNNGALRFDQGANTWGDANGAFDAGASGTINNHSAGNVTVYLGALSGSSGSKLGGSDQTGPGVDTYVIGGLNSNTTFAGTITNGTSATTPHTVAVTKIGSGTFTLTGTNAYSGGTIVSNGTLLVNNTGGSATGTGAVTVVNGATLSGSGIIGGPVTVNGTLTPGNGVGTLAISNSLVVNGGAVLQYALGTNSDLTVVSSNLTLGGTLDVVDAGGFTNTTYMLFSYGGGLTCTNLSLGYTPPGFSCVINTNTVGQVNLVVTPYVSPYDAWQLQYFNCTNCAQGAASADPDGDGQNNLTEFLAGTDPTNGVSTWGIQASPTIGLVPILVSFSENSTGASITNRLWDFGDGSVGSGSNPSHTYTNAGTFSVGLTIFNVNGTASLMATNLITVAPFATWTNANASGNWSDATSWDPSVIPDLGASVVFAGAGATAVVNNVSRNVGNVTFDATGGFTVTASGGAGLTISNGIAVTTNFSYTLAAPVVLGGNNLWSVSSNGSLQVSGPVSGMNSIIEDGGGTLILSGTNSYSGSTTVSNGTLQVSGDGQITNSPVIALASGATLDVSGHTGGSMTLVSGQSLMGNGAIRGDLILADGATLSPGSSVGTLTFLNDLVLSNAAVLQYGLGAVSDQSVVSSNLTLGGTLNINDTGGFGPGVYTLVTYGGALTYNGVSIGTAPPEFVYTIDTNSAGQIKLEVMLPPTTVNMVAADLQDGSGNLAPSNSVAVLVVDTGNNGFADPQPGFALSVGAVWGADDTVVGLWDLGDSVNCSGNDGGALCAQTIVSYMGGIAPGQALKLYWFPSLTLSSNTLGVTAYGRYTDPVGIDGGDAWQMPAGGSTLNLLFLTDPWGSNLRTNGQATLSTAGVAPLASFTTSPINGGAPLAVTFTDTSSGSLPLSLSWDLGDSTTTNTAGGASFTHTYPIGTYSVTLTASNFVGTSTLVSNNLITVVTALQAWQMQYFGCTNCPQAAPDADPLGKGISNTNQFLLGLNPTNAASMFRIISAVRNTTDVVVTWQTAGVRTNALQVTSGNANGSYNTNNFQDITTLVISVPGDTVTNCVDVGGATNSPSRYYRIRLVP